jgi:hypothetical protein
MRMCLSSFYFVLQTTEAHISLLGFKQHHPWSLAKPGCNLEFSHVNGSALLQRPDSQSNMCKNESESSR